MFANKKAALLLFADLATPASIPVKLYTFTIPGWNDTIQVEAGTTVRIPLSVTSLGVAADPGTVTIRFRTPPNNTLIAAVGVPPIVKDAVGQYHFDQATTALQAGRWSGTWAGSQGGTLSFEFWVYKPAGA